MWRSAVRCLFARETSLHVTSRNDNSCIKMKFQAQYKLIGSDLMDDQSLIGDGKTVIEMISDQVPKLIGDQFDQPSNVHEKRNLRTSS